MRDSDDGARRLSDALVLTGAAVLAFHPVLWLVRTWVSPTYNSMGGYVFAVVCVAFAWSVSSPRASEGSERRRRALGLLIASAAVRLASRLLAINMLGALTLVIDVYAIGTLANLDRRLRAVSPLWLAAAFAFSLPLERVVQRLIGFPLQQASASGACSLLRMGFEGAHCAGTRLFLNGADVLVDLPCSGARGLIQLLVLFAFLGAIVRPSVRLSVVGIAAVLTAGFVSNVFRIALLAVGIGYRDELGGVDVMSEPWHSAIGLVCVALAAASLVLWSRYAERDVAPAPIEARTPRAAWNLTPTIAVGFVGLCAVIISLPSRPVDVAEAIASPELPAYLDGDVAEPAPLNDREREYFTLFGGGASRARYGDSTLLVVRTSSPLRHLHAPDICLTGAGLDVSFLGVDHTHIPSAVYRAEAPDGAVYRVAVTYASERGEVVPSIAEVAWRWFQAPTTWSAVQRITDWEAPAEEQAHFDNVVARALDLGPTAPNPKETP